MSSDEQPEAREEQETVQIDVEPFERDDLLKTLEMDSSEVMEVPARQGDPSTCDDEQATRERSPAEVERPDPHLAVTEETRPIQPILDATTRRHEVPPEVLARAMRTTQGDVVFRDDGWIEFVAVADAQGRVELPAALAIEIGPGETLCLRVKRQHDE